MSAHRVLASLGHDPVSHGARARRHSIVRPVTAQHACAPANIYPLAQFRSKTLHSRNLPLLHQHVFAHDRQACIV
eukprot:10080940-Alexandrium_andersonii.AAC.1